MFKASDIFANKAESIDLLFLSILLKLLWSQPISAASHLIERRCAFRWRLISWHIFIFESIKKSVILFVDSLFLRFGSGKPFLPNKCESYETVHAL